MGGDALGTSLSGHRPTECMIHYCDRVAVAGCSVCARVFCAGHLHFDREDAVMCVDCRWEIENGGPRPGPDEQGQRLGEWI